MCYVYAIYVAHTHLPLFLGLKPQAFLTIHFHEFLQFPKLKILGIHMSDDWNVEPWFPILNQVGFGWYYSVKRKAQIKLSKKASSTILKQDHKFRLDYGKNTLLCDIAWNISWRHSLQSAQALIITFLTAM